MFEYLMPLLVMPTYEHTLLDQSYRAAVERQIEYGSQRGVPWGLSESGYNTFDAALNYQYRAFGVPGLGLARGLADELVIAPYASALALMVEPRAACRNLRRLAHEGAAGQYGFYEAVDYAPARLTRGQSSAVVRSFMAHHQGMTLAVSCIPAAWAADAEALRGAARVSGDAAPASGAHPEIRCAVSAPRDDLGQPRPAQPAADAAARSAERRDAQPRSAVAVERPLPRHGHERGRRLQPVERPRGHALARGPDARQLGQLLLRARRRKRRVLVRRASADARAGRRVRGDVLGGSRRISPPRPRLRHAPGNRRFARRRYRASPAAYHEPLPRIEIDRRDELRRSRARQRRRRRPASGVQQPFRADGDPPPAARDPVHAPAPLPRGAGAVDVSPHGAPWAGGRSRVV